MHTPQTKFDVVLVVLGLGVIILNALLFLIYIVLRWRYRDVRIGARKADRPLWVAMVVSSGAFWMLASLQLTGCIMFVPPSRYSCVGLKYLLQYTFGYVLWTGAVVYRMIRLYLVYSVITRPLHAAATVACICAPFAVLSMVAMFTNMMIPSGFATGSVCMQGDLWNGLLFGMLGVYLSFYVFLLIRLLTVIGRLKGMKKYIIIAGLSFTFVLADAVLCIKRTYRNPLWRHLLMLLVIVLIAIQSWTVFGNVLVRTKRKTTEDADEESVGSSQRPLMLVEDADPLPPKQPLHVIQERALRRAAGRRAKAVDSVERAFHSLQSVLSSCATVREEAEPDDELDERVPHYSVPDDYIMYRDLEKYRMGSDFVEFARSLHPVDAERLDRQQGVFRVANMYCAARREDVDGCLRYLEMDGHGE